MADFDQDFACGSLLGLTVNSVEKLFIEIENFTGIAIDGEF